MNLPYTLTSLTAVVHNCCLKKPVNCKCCQGEIEIRCYSAAMAAKGWVLKSQSLYQYVMQNNGKTHVAHLAISQEAHLPENAWFGVTAFLG